MTMYSSAAGDLCWRISRTCDRGACVKVARHDDSVVFGNTSQPDGPVYGYAGAKWKEFLAGVKLGDLNDIAWRHESKVR